MSTYTRLLLSGSTNGKPVKIAATSTPGTLLHTAVAGTAAIDEIYAWLANLSAADVAVTIEWGSTTDPDGLLVKGYVVPANSRIAVIEGMNLQNGLVVGVFAATANVITATGYVNRIS